MGIQRRLDSTKSAFFWRTISAQIHVVGLLLTAMAMADLLPKARVSGGDHFWACLIFLLTGAMVFLTSSVYHFLHDGYRISRDLETFFEALDHSCIYLFIAGTYSPLLINTVDQPWRNYLLIGIWGIAFLGITYTLMKPYLFPTLQSRFAYTSLFVIMGLLFIVRIGEISIHLTLNQIALLVAGNSAYLLGAIGYAFKRPVLLVNTFGYHELWHVMVLLGASFHFFFVYSLYM